MQSLSDEELARQLIIDSTTFLSKQLMLDMPEIFVQISDPANPEQYKVITGLCLLVRNPAFHPYIARFPALNLRGDIRVVKAVDCDDLLHLVYHTRLSTHIA